MPKSPATVDVLIELAIKRERRANFGEAIALLNAAIELDPGRTDAWLHLAELQQLAGRTEASIACFARALATNPDSLDALVNLGARYLDIDQVEDAIGMFERAADLQPGDSQIHYNLGLALNMAGRNEVALKALSRSCDINQDNASARFTRSLILLEEERFAEAWKEYAWRWRLDQSPKLPTGLPEWRGESFDGKTLLVLPEGGFGDTIWASRFLPQAKERGGTIVLKTRPETRRLMAKLEGVDFYVDDDLDFADFDLLCPALSLPGCLAFDGLDAPPPSRLYAAEGLDDKIKLLLGRAGSRLKVGIVWSGSEGFVGNHRRSAPFSRFLALAQNPDIQFYSLQKSPKQAVLREQGLGGLIVDADTSDFAETAALIEALDLVVMTDSSIAHVAGSLGKPVWNILDFAPYWIYRRQGERTPWYLSMRLFRQKRPGDWAAVFEEVAAALANAVQAHRSGRWSDARFAI
ncbi:MAG: tetratricopeptide repeat-containing glycosyltransferase family protein [Alphaproteobacteria bacterium]|nr:tetratricopeptide repeat-containing glycosyltransferase family protein [Alphaproteobacteria bacterium]